MGSRAATWSVLCPVHQPGKIDVAAFYIGGAHAGQFYRHQIIPFINEGLLVNKTELIEHIAKHADISKAAATRALESTIGAVKLTLKKGGSVSLVGFGTFAVGRRAARIGRNPRTGDAIKIKAAKVPKFRPGKALKDALN